MTNEELNNLISQTDIVALVSKYVTLTKSGKNYIGLCPFHNEKTPSFFVSPDKGLATCFGCHKGGNALTFIKEINNVSTAEAINLLAEFNGITISNNYKKENLNRKYYNLMDFAKDFYKLFLHEDKSAIDANNYLKSRGLTDEIIEKFQIGLAPKKKDTIYQVLTQNGFLELDIFDMGLINNNQYGFYDIFQDRIMFPIFDEFGNTLGFSGRRYDVSSANDKYINSTDTKIFNKGNVVFNLNLAKLEINKKHRVILHEGQMDVIASYKAGLGEAVCSLGTNITDYQIKLLRKYTDNVIIAFDGDKAGIKSSIRAIELFKKNNFNIHLVLFPNNLDPDEFIKQYGINEYLKFFESNIIDEIEYQFRVLIKDKDFNDKNVFDETLNESFKLINNINSNGIKEKYFERLKDALNVSLESIIEDYNRFNNKPKINNNTKKQYKKRFNSIAELRIFIHAKKSKDLALKIDKEINAYLNAFVPMNQNLWILLINEYYEKFDTFMEGYFVKMLSNDEMEQYLYINEKLSKDVTNYDINDLEKCIKMLKIMSLDTEIEIIQNKIKHENNQEKKKELYTKLFKLKNERGNKNGLRDSH